MKPEPKTDAKLDKELAESNSTKLDKDLAGATATVTEGADKLQKQPPFPNPGDGFVNDRNQPGPHEKFPGQAVLDADGNPIPQDERLADPKKFFEPLGWEAVGIHFTPPPEHRTFFVNEMGQAETVNFERKYTAKQALRVHDRTQATIRAEEQAMKLAEQQRIADARRAAVNRV